MALAATAQGNRGHWKSVAAMGQPALPICQELICPGAGAIVLTNQNGAVRSGVGPQAGLIVDAGLNGLVIPLQQRCVD